MVEKLYTAVLPSTGGYAMGT